MKYSAVVLLFLLQPAILCAQGTFVSENTSQKFHDLNQRLLAESVAKKENSAAEREDYRIGAEDLIDISVFEVPEMSRTVRVSISGEISLPLIGTVKVAGLTTLELEQLLTNTLQKSYLKDPQVTVFVREFHSDPVSVVGAVKVPGLYHIQTRKSLVEVLAMAQGFSEGPARLPGRDIVVTRSSRHSAPAASGSTSADSVPGANNSGEPQTITIPIKGLLESDNSKWNIPIYPGDVIKVAPAGTVYVAGDVHRPGGFPLTDFDNISVIQALSMAGGTLKTASKKDSRIIRRNASGKRIEQKINLVRVLQGKDPDVMLGPNDILFVPKSVGKAAALRALETAIQTGSGMLMWGHVP